MIVWTDNVYLPTDCTLDGMCYTNGTKSNNLQEVVYNRCGSCTTGGVRRAAGYSTTVTKITECSNVVIFFFFNL
jgi:hypothetical protein